MSRNACDEDIVVPPGPGQGIIGSGSIGIQPKSGSPVSGSNPNIGNPIDGICISIPTTRGQYPEYPGSYGYVIPNGGVEIGVANTSNFPTDANGNVDYVAFAEKMQQDAEAIVTQLQNLQSSKAAAIASIPDGPSCNSDFEVQANTFLVNCNSFVVDHCSSGDPTITFNCSTFSIKSGAVTITVDGDDITISGGTLNLPAGTTVNGAAILTSLPDHTHSAGTYDAGGTAVTGESGDPT